MREQTSNLSVQLFSGEAVVVAPIEFWDGLIASCEILAQEYDPESTEHKLWVDAAEHLRFQSLSTLFVAEEEEIFD